MLDFFKRPKVKLILIGIAACISVPLEALTHNCLSCIFDHYRARSYQTLEVDYA